MGICLYDSLKYLNFKLFRHKVELKIENLVKLNKSKLPLDILMKFFKSCFVILSIRARVNMQGNGRSMFDPLKINIR